MNYLSTYINSTTSIIILFLLSFTIILNPDICWTQVEEWVARYNGPGDSDDRATALALDAAGNVYVTGYNINVVSGTSTDYTTIKYDAGGNELWTARYIGGGNYAGSATALAVDKKGNVYVTGVRSSSQAWATIKYDANGKEAWNAFHDGPGKAIALDPEGNVYVTSSSGDFSTSKYDSNGSELWVARYNTSYGSVPFSIAVDTAGNVYVAGIFYLESPNSIRYPLLDYSTIKYDANGNQLWVSNCGCPSGSSFDIYFNAKLLIDATGNVYAGLAKDTIKFNSNGNKIWAARYDPSNINDHATALALDPVGNAYVTGYRINGSPGDFYSLGTPDFTTIKYDMNGNELWVARYNSAYGSVAGALAVDVMGNVYVTGYVNSSPAPVKGPVLPIPSEGPSSDYVTIKYDSNGNELWVASYNGLANNSDYATAIAVDAASNVYVTGFSIGFFDNQDYATIKLTPSDNNNPGGGSGGSSIGNGGGNSSNGDEGCFITVIKREAVAHANIHGDKFNR